MVPKTGRFAWLVLSLQHCNQFSLNFCQYNTMPLADYWC